MCLNIGKCEAIVFKGLKKYLYPSSRGFEATPCIGGQLVHVSEELKYLGVVFHSNFEFVRHVNHILEKAKKLFWAFQRIICRTGGLSLPVKLLIYKQIIRPIVAYAFPVWYGISSHQMERIRIWERGILRSCLNLKHHLGQDGIWRLPPNYLIYKDLPFKRIDVFLAKSALNFLHKATYCENALVARSLENSFPHVDGLLEANYHPPNSLEILNNEGLLFNEDQLVFYHRQYKTFDLYNTVYQLEQ